jgi:hypothetical protein
MSDTEVIIQLLRKVEWRSRANRVRHDLAFALALFLAVMIALRVWTLVSHVPVLAVAIIIGASVSLLVAYVVKGLGRKGTLDDVAVSVDQKAALRDEIRTAFWFINNPRSSEWVDRQIQRAAVRARDIDVGHTYPALLPRSSYVAAAMLVFLVGLNFVKGPAAAFALKNQRIAATGASSDAEFTQGIRIGLQEIAKALRRAAATTPIAEAIEQRHLDIAADELRDISAEVGIRTDTEEEVLQSFRQAATNDQPGLKALSNTLGELANAMENNDRAAVQQYAEEAALELERIEGETLAREPRDDRQASTEIETPPGGGDTASQNAENTPATAANSAGVGGFGRGRQEGVRQGPPVSLEVKLEQERLKGLESGVGTPSSLELQEATRREQSSRAYQNGAPRLAPAQKEVLNRTKIPWEYRPLIKRYFQALHGSER